VRRIIANAFIPIPANAWLFQLNKMMARSMTEAMNNPRINAFCKLATRFLAASSKVGARSRLSRNLFCPFPAF
jgi:hypothetical protein